MAVARELPEFIKEVPEVLTAVLMKEGKGRATCTCTMMGVVGQKWQHNFFTVGQILNVASLLLAQ